MKMTAVEMLKSNGLLSPAQEFELDEVLDCFVQDKEYSPQQIRRLAFEGVFGPLMSHLVLREGTGFYQALNLSARNIVHRKPRYRGLERYRATADQNLRVDYALRARGKLPFFSGGAATDFFTKIDTILPPAVRPVKIAVIGGGVNGMMVSLALGSQGFTDVTQFEKRKEFHGIWNRADVARSRNNPRDLSYFGTVLTKAPGDGQSVFEFSRRMDAGFTQKSSTIKEIGSVVRVSDGIVLRDAATDQEIGKFAIVINCSGTGPPAPINDPGRMTASATSTLSGTRWQKNLLPIDIHSHTFLIIGLGNSTAEMLLQLRQAMDKGFECDYRVLTHYSKDAVMNPDDTVDGQRVFRDLSKPDLTSYAGDLDDLRRAYLMARNSGKIVTDVRHWGRDLGGDTIAWKTKNQRASMKVTDHYTLIGYKWARKDYEKMGISLSYNGYPLVDYDGEYLDELRRPIKGYFGLGPMIETPENRNAVVIPGTMFRMGDLLFSVIVRAAEHVKF